MTYQKALVAASAFGFAASLATAAFAAPETFDASANIQAAIALTNVANLDFANIIPDATNSGTVLVDSAGARTCAPVLACSGSTTAAEFSVSGEDGSTYSITLPAAANITSGSDTMLVNNFVSSVGASSVLTGGADTFAIGATLNVGAAQAVGSYTGTFSVTVD